MTDAPVFVHSTEKQAFAKTLNQILGSTGHGFTGTGAQQTHARFQQETARCGSCAEQGEKQGCLQSETVHIDTRMLHLVENNVIYKNTTEKLLQQITIITHAIGEGGK